MTYYILFNEKSKQPDNQLSYLFNRRPDLGINISTVLDEELKQRKEEIFLKKPLTVLQMVVLLLK